MKAPMERKLLQISAENKPKNLTTILSKSSSNNNNSGKLLNPNCWLEIEQRSIITAHKRPLGLYASFSLFFNKPQQKSCISPLITMQYKCSSPFFNATH
jgi:hypothetical protein